MAGVSRSTKLGVSGSFVKFFFFFNRILIQGVFENSAQLAIEIKAFYDRNEFFFFSRLPRQPYQKHVADWRS